MKAKNREKTLQGSIIKQKNHERKIKHREKSRRGRKLASTTNFCLALWLLGRIQGGLTQSAGRCWFKDFTTKIDLSGTWDDPNAKSVTVQCDHSMNSFYFSAWFKHEEIAEPGEDWIVFAYSTKLRFCSERTLKASTSSLSCTKVQAYGRSRPSMGVMNGFFSRSRSPQRQWKSLIERV